MDMDINALRSVVTVLSFVLFLGIALWTWSKRQRSQHEAAAQLPFLEEDGEPIAAAAARFQGSK